MSTSQVNRTVRNLKDGKPQHIIVYGTSLTAGGAWVEQVRAVLETRFPGLARITNSGKGAMWSGWGVDNLDERVVRLKPDAVIMEFGMNDAYLPYATTTEMCCLNLTKMIDRILAAHPECEIILWTTNECIGKHRETRPKLEEYYQVYREVAAERGLRFVDLYPEWVQILKNDPDAFNRYVPDGIHPRELGSEKVTTPAILAALGV